MVDGGIVGSQIQHVAGVRQVIANACENNPLAASGGVTVLGASKSQPAAMIEAMVAAGVMDFGENRVQEAEAKWPILKKKYPEIRLHLIGSLQSNKAADAVALFDVIQTVDRVKVADVLAAEMARQGKVLPCYVQVNIGGEAQKAGVGVPEAPALIAHCRALGLVLEGLMCVPPLGHHPAPYFALLAKIAKSAGVSGLSMGMSDDYETAVRMGATCVRLGRVLFGERAV